MIVCNSQNKHCMKHWWHKIPQKELGVILKRLISFDKIFTLLQILCSFRRYKVWMLKVFKLKSIRWVTYKIIFWILFEIKSSVEVLNFYFIKMFIIEGYDYAQYYEIYDLWVLRNFYPSYTNMYYIIQIGHTNNSNRSI